MTVSAPLPPVVATHLEALRRDHPDAEATVLPDQTVLVRVPNVRLPNGWSRAETEVCFIVPPMYPVAPPDCFWAELGLRLANGALPQASNESTPIPHIPNGQRLWFSWHVQAWNPLTASLRTYVRVVEDRLKRAH